MNEHQDFGFFFPRSFVGTHPTISQVMGKFIVIMPQFIIWRRVVFTNLNLMGMILMRFEKFGSQIYTRFVHFLGEIQKSKYLFTEKFIIIMHQICNLVGSYFSTNLHLIEMILV